jgi:D-alanyl-D-alanine dipeptidase
MRHALALLLIAVPAYAGSPRDLVDVAKLIPDAVIDMRYDPHATCRLRRDVARRLVKVAARLRKDKRRLLIWDCYRSPELQQQLWERTPDERYVANPKKGSRHSRGAAIDLALVDADGEPVVLPTAFDEFSEAAHRKHALKGETGIEARRLERAMTKQGFVGLSTEWWHFDAP